MVDLAEALDEIKIVINYTLSSIKKPVELIFNPNFSEDNV